MSVQSVDLRPLKAGEILDRAFRLYRAKFWFLIRVTGTLLGPFLILKLLSLFIFRNITYISYIQIFLADYLLSGAMIWATSHAYLGGNTSIMDAYRRSRRYFKLIIGAGFLSSISYIHYAVVSMIFASFLQGRNVTIGVQILYAVIIFVGGPCLLFFQTRLWFAVPAVMLEDLNIRKSLKRTWHLTSQDFWHVLVVAIASILLGYLLDWLPTYMIYSLIRFFIQAFGAAPQINTALSLVVNQLGLIIFTPLFVCIRIIMYYDLRVRREGYDLELALQPTSETLDITHESI